MKRVSVTLSLLLLVAGFGFAQSPQDNWDNLKQLRQGQRIEVVDSSMKTVKGTFVSVTDEAISLAAGKREESVARANVVRVSVRDTSHRTRNVALGAGILGGVGLAVGAVGLAANSNEGNGCGACVAVIAAGFGGGVALGAIPGSRTIYRAQKVERSGSH
ncbi:MAG TPA: hypothetical protein VKM93_19180 [Terriglobia bacterium]|nr:hypothetical protein [Terriglobia bacterium]